MPPLVRSNLLLVNYSILSVTQNVHHVKFILHYKLRQSAEWERYDLVIPQQFYESELLQPLLTLIRGESFRKVVAELEGYDSSGMGEVVREG